LFHRDHVEATAIFQEEKPMAFSFVTVGEKETLEACFGDRVA
jgi:hypothetical protein